MRSRSFSIILEECLQRLDGGESLPELLADFPELADQLKPLLLVAMASRAIPVPIPSQRAQRLGRNQMLAEMNRVEIKKAFRKKATIPTTSRWMGGLINLARSRGLNRLAYSYRLAIVSLVLVLSGGYFTISASASSQPGDLLYTLKMGLQRVGLTLIIPAETLTDGDDPLSITPEPRQFGRYVWALDDIYGIDQDAASGMSDSIDDRVFSTTELASDKDEIKAEKEAEKDAEKDLKEEEKAAAEAEKDAEKDLKEEEKAAAEAEKDAEKDLKEEEKEAEKDLKEQEKEDAEDLRETEKEERKEDKIEKESIKDKDK